jgi:hypothetical protein
MSNFSARFKAGLAIAAVAVLLASCTNFEKVYQRNFDFPPPDSTKFSKLDESSGKQFDLLTGKSTGINFSNAWILNSSTTITSTLTITTAEV